MNYSHLYENEKRGTSEFPLEFYHLTQEHPRYQMTFHWHLDYEMIYVREGQFSLTLDGRVHPLTAGDAAWISEGLIHGGFPENCVYECLVYDLHALTNNTPLCARSAAVFTADPRSHAAVFKADSTEAQLIRAIFDTDRSTGYEWTLIGLIWQLMGQLMRQDATNPLPHTRQVKQLKNVLSHIRKHYDEPITLQDLADTAGMTPRYFCRAFAAMTGKTPIAYLNYYRIEQAGERLLLTDERITDIAFSCGFNDAGYFTKAFTKQKGISPSRYRTQN
ncbi:MAG: helix-turn-helix transcriptional regulator [Clostridia bacterium]|nr:helix-turn-helix transcriptional regulator [Clostridia bacterium]